ncbi:MAG: hypothetical protein IJY49_03040 [Clostridia bacterium]|nr:hypothetical protein [Clostridia bacterium]
MFVTFSKTKLKDFALPLVIIVFMGLMLAFPEYYMKATGRGLALFASNVLPAMFPFLFLNTMLSNTKAIPFINKAFEKPVNKVFGVVKEGAFVLISALICGYPVGAVTTARLYENGDISRDDAKSFLPFTSLAGPVFILSTVSSIFEDKNVGLVVLISHYVGTFINGLLWRFVSHTRVRKRNHIENGPVAQYTSSILSADFESGGHNLLGEAVTSSALSMLTVGGYIVLFGLVVDTFALLPFWGDLPAILRVMFTFPVEMTRGVVEASTLDFLPLAVGFATLSVTFGGVSVLAQQYHFLSRCNCGVFDLILPKISQGILGFFSAIIFTIIIFNIS